MEPITLRLPAEIMRRLQEEARRTGLEPVEVAENILADRLAPDMFDERERAIRALREAGMLSELRDEMKAFAQKLREESGAGSLTDEELSSDVETALRKSTGKSLSEIILEQRESKI